MEKKESVFKKTQEGKLEEGPVLKSTVEKEVNGKIKTIAGVDIKKGKVEYKTPKEIAIANGEAPEKTYEEQDVEKE